MKRRSLSHRGNVLDHQVVEPLVYTDDRVAVQFEPVVLDQDLVLDDAGLSQSCVHSNKDQSSATM